MVKPIIKANFGSGKLLGGHVKILTLKKLGQLGSKLMCG